FVGADNVARRPLEVEPGKVTRKSANERLDKSQTHYEQSRRDSIELWLDPRANHVRERNGQCPTKHQIGDNSERRQKNSKAGEKKREREPFDTAEIGGDVRLRSGVHRLEKSFTENTVIDDRPINEPTEPRCAINLTTPFRSPGRPEKNQMFEAKERFSFAIAFLLFQKCAQSKSAMVPDNRSGTESDDAARLLQAPAKIDIVSGFMIFGIETAALFEGPAIKGHVTAGNVFGDRVGQQNVARPAGRGRHASLNRVLRRRTHVRPAHAGVM